MVLDRKGEDIEQQPQYVDSALWEMMRPHSCLYVVEPAPCIRDSSSLCSGFS